MDIAVFESSEVETVLRVRRTAACVTGPLTMAARELLETVSAIVGHPATSFPST